MYMKNINAADVLIFTDQFAAMMRSRLKLMQVLDNLSRETLNRRLARVLEDVAKSVRGGEELGDAIARHPNVFDPIYVNVVRSGMNSGRLAEALTQVSEYLARRDVIRSQVMGALSYPMFLGVVFVVMINLMSFMILPRFEKIFNSFHRELPEATRIMMTFVTWYTNNIIPISIFWIAVIGGWLWWSRTHRLIWDRNKLKAPLFGRILRLAAFARFTRTLGIQLRNRVNILTAFHLSASTTRNAFLEQELKEVREDVIQGESIADAFRKHEIFSGIVLEMVHSGEEAGTLDELLLSAADYFDRLLQSQVRILTELINPILILIMGVAISAMLVAAFLPVFEMGQAVGAGGHGKPPAGQSRALK